MKKAYYPGNYISRKQNNTPTASPTIATTQSNSENQKSFTPEQKSKFQRIIEQTSLYFGIIGVLISTFFAWITYINTDQIKELQSIVKASNATVEASNNTSNRLMGVIEELRTVNLSTRDLMKIQNAQLFTSSLLQGKTNDIFELQNNANKMRFEVFVMSLDDRLIYAEEYGTWDSLQQATYINETIELFNKISDNPYLLSHKEIYKKWYSLYVDLDYFRTKLKNKNIYDSEWWEENFPFKALTQRILDFYLEVNVKEYRHLNDPSKTKSKFVDQLLEVELKEFIENMNVGRNEIKEATKDFKEINYQELLEEFPSRADKDSLLKEFKKLLTDLEGAKELLQPFVNKNPTFKGRLIGDGSMAFLKRNSVFENIDYKNLNMIVDFNKIPKSRIKVWHKYREEIAKFYNDYNEFLNAIKEKVEWLEQQSKRNKK